ncbi:MAG: phospho-sugar mutase [Vallitaleaceae bacterium]|nr:phospho-sugar mutase [Vallitaleaceae bacterium]
MDYKMKYQEWVTNPIFDEETRKELLAIADDAKEIEDRFYRELEFGTGGLRGVIGAGTNRLNIYTIRKATQGLANYIRKEGKEAMKKGVAIAYDSRRFSPEFADEAARVLAANDIKAYVFESLRPTPELSFALRQLKAIAGIVVTASHNPPEYNGYKVYWEDGAQITAPKDVEIIEEVNAITDYNLIQSMSKTQAMEAGLYEMLGSDMDDLYIAELKKLIIDGEVIKKEAKDFTVVYTPLHGTGNLPVRRILKEIGFENVFVVPEQELPDGNFPTVAYPNPEDIKAFSLALALGKEKNADVIMATDPDADRLGVLAKTKEGDYKALNGNNIGMLLMEYILKRKKDMNKLPENGAVIGTIVSTYMSRPIAKEYGVELMEVLTGFKYIGEKIKEFEENKSYEFLFGYEESYGCLIGTHARDKDAIVAVMGVAELAAYYKSIGLTLYEALQELFAKYGYYQETLKSITLKGIEGVQKINSILEELRKNPIKEVNGKKILFFKDYQSGEVFNQIDGTKTKTGLPASNVLYFDMEEDAWFCVRPSGTEPKVKFYFGVKGKNQEEADQKSAQLEIAVMELIEKML